MAGKMMTSTMTTETADPIVLADRWDPLARAVPGSYWEPVQKAYVLDPGGVTPRVAMMALKLFPELALEAPELTEIRDQAIQDVRPFDNATPFNVDVYAPHIRERVDLYSFQSLDLGYMSAVLESHGGAYIGWERGLGKTIGALSIVEAMDSRRVLIVAPNTAKESVWKQELEALDFDREFHIEVLPNVKRKREQCMSRIQEYEKAGDSHILIVHYEALSIIANELKNGRGWNKYGTWDIVIADEAHRIKNPKAQMTRALKKIPTEYKLALSGSIIQNHANELFSPLQWLYPDRYRSAWRDWNDRFLDFVEGGYGKVFVGIKLDKIEELRDELGVFMVYRRKEDELDLPPRVDEDRFIEISPSQRRAYNELVDTCMTQLDSGELIAAQQGLPMLTKLRQVATGLDQFGDVQDSTKLDLATEMILDNEDEAFVVFSWYKASAHSLQDRLEAQGIETFLVDGDVRQEHRNDRIARFQAGEGRVFIGTLATLGESVNLFRANNAIFIDRHWNPATNVQAADRIYRIGQDRPVTITHIIAKDTVDEHRVLPAISNKEALRALILGAAR